MTTLQVFSHLLRPDTALSEWCALDQVITAFFSLARGEEQVSLHLLLSQINLRVSIVNTTHTVITAVAV